MGVFYAYCPAEAHTIFKRDPYAFDLVITDQNMPAMQGVALIRAVKAVRPDLKAILCSGSGCAEEDRILAREADGFFGKPGSTDTLAKMIRTVRDGQVTA